MSLFSAHFLPFMKYRYIAGSSVLVALSGGPDSMALLHLMLEYRAKKGATFAVAHVDHGWREESGSEAEELENLCRSLEVPFHLCRLNPNSFYGNKEDFCRKRRMEFFKTLCNESHYAAVLLGHHQNDQAETVLKRVFEGAKIEHCRGMGEEALIDGVTYWRPLLNVPKDKILQWLEGKGISYFDDATNRDPAYLRARMREDILPSISQQFGKNVEAGLAFLGKEADHLNAFMSGHVAQWLERGVPGFFGRFWDLQAAGPKHFYEARYFISEVFPASSREISYQAAQDLVEGAVDKRYVAGGMFLYLDRKQVLLANEEIPKFTFEGKPLARSGQVGNWAYEVVERKLALGDDLWKQPVDGEMAIPIRTDFEGCMIGFPPAGSKELKLLRNRYLNHKVPVFLRDSIPIVWKEGEIVCDFLTTDRLPKSDQSVLSLRLKKLFIENEGNM